MRVALYARCSADNPREASIDDQLRLCRLHAERRGWTVVESYHDRAVSGAALIRSGIQALMADALRGKFEAVIAEALDRISRDQKDVASVCRRMAFAGVKIITLSEGQDQPSACQLENHDECLVPPGSRRQGATKPARPRRSPQSMRRPALRL